MRRPDPHDGIEQGLLALGHRGIGNILRGFGQADDQPGILLRKEAFGNDDVEIAGQCDGPNIVNSVMKRWRSTIFSPAS